MTMVSYTVTPCDICYGILCVVLSYVVNVIFYVMFIMCRGFVMSCCCMLMLFLYCLVVLNCHIMLC